MTKIPRVSIAMCTYNGANYLESQIESIYNQRFRDFELIVVDDLSTDSTVEILRRYANLDTFTYFVNPSNLGSTKNFEKAIRLCRGEIIVLADQDDIWAPDKLDRLVTVLDSGPSVGYVFSNANIVGKDLQPLGYTLWDANGFGGALRELFQLHQVKAMLRVDFITGATMAFKSELRNSILPISDLWVHDGWIAIVASCIGMGGEPLPDTLVQYRQHSNQQVGATRPGTMTIAGRLSSYRQRSQLFADQLEQRAKRMDSLYSHLRKLNLGNQHAQNLELVCQAAKHFHNRSNIIATHTLDKILKIGREVASRRYATFSNSLISAFKDLWT